MRTIFGRARSSTSSSSSAGRRSVALPPESAAARATFSVVPDLRGWRRRWRCDDEELGGGGGVGRCCPENASHRHRGCETDIAAQASSRMVRRRDDIFLSGGSVVARIMMLFYDEMRTEGAFLPRCALCAQLLLRFFRLQLSF